ncbi:MAG: hypothetical protein ACO3GP_02855 [Candidatus Limnocylindrus sp.]
MATFPALEPNTRSYRLPRFPVTSQPAWGTEAVRFSHGPQSFGYILSLGYENLLAADAALLRSHFRSQAGGFEAFTLDPVVTRGHGATDLAPASTLWRYTGPPEETHRSGGLVNVEVELESVRGLVVSGAGLSIACSLLAGAVTAGSSAAGADLTITASLEAGAGTGD